MSNAFIGGRTNIAVLHNRSASAVALFQIRVAHRHLNHELGVAEGCQHRTRLAISVRVVSHLKLFAGAVVDDFLETQVQFAFR